MPPIAHGSDATLEDATRSEPTKQTEIGEIPESWRVVRLGETASELRSGITPRGGEKVYLKVGIPLIRSQNVLMNKLSLSDVAFISPAMHESMIGSAVQPGDVLLNITGASIGRVTFVPDELKVANVNQHVCRIRLASHANPAFVSYYLSTPRGQAQVMGSQFGTTRQGLNYGNVRAIRIPVPPIEEQRAIAQALDAVQAAKEARQRELVLERERKAALMEYLFTHGTRGEMTKQMTIGEIPESWHMTKLGDACEFLQYGTSHRCDAPSDGVPVLGIRNVVHGRVAGNGLRFLQTTAEERKKLELQGGDIIFVRTNANREYTGRCAVFRNEVPNALFASYLIRARLKAEALLPDFVREYTDTWRGKAYLSGRASHAADGKFNINTQTIRGVLVPQPQLGEQREIAMTLRACDTKIDFLEKEVRLLEELFKATLEELMTGRLSAVPLIEEHQAQ